MGSALSLLPPFLSFPRFGNQWLPFEMYYNNFFTAVRFHAKSSTFFAKNSTNGRIFTLLHHQNDFKVTVIGICHFLSSSHTDWNDLTI